MKELVAKLILDPIVLFYLIIIGVSIFGGFVGYQLKKFNVFEKTKEIKITVKMFKKVVIGIVCFIIAIIFLNAILGAIYLFFWGDLNKSDSYRLGALVSFLSPFLSFLGAYLLFIFGNRYNKKQEYLKEIKDKQQSLTNVNNCIVDSISYIHHPINNINGEYERVFNNSVVESLIKNNTSANDAKQEIFKIISDDEEIEKLKKNQFFNLLLEFKGFIEKEINLVKEVSLLETMDWKSDLRVVIDKTYHDETHIFLDTIENKSFENIYRFLLARDNCITFLEFLDRIEVLNKKDSRKLPSGVILKRFFNRI